MKFCIIIFTTITLTLIISSCTNLLAPIAISKNIMYTIDEENPIKSCIIYKYNNTIQIMSMNAAPPFDSNKMYYMRETNQLEYYAHHYFINSPNKIIEKLMVQTLTNRCIYQNVLNADNTALAELRLETGLLFLQQNKLNNNTSQIKLVIKANLINNSDNQVLKSKIFIEQTTQALSPQGFILGSNQVTNNFLNQLEQWLDNK